jgi:hypothetical protein
MKTRKSGRPKGSVSLSAKIERTILAFISAGVYDYIAAEAAGISDRTFRDWIARGEGRGSRPGSPKLRAFATKVRTARASARASAEVAVLKDHPIHWLRYEARSAPGREGWSEEKTERKGAGSRPEGLDDEELLRATAEIASDLIRMGVLPPPRPNGMKTNGKKKRSP